MAASRRRITTVLLDVTGVLYESGAGGGKVIDGSPQAVQRLRQAGFKLKFCTNETNTTRKALVEKLIRHGYTLSEQEVHAPAPACKQYLKQNDLRPHLIVHPQALADYEGVERSDPNCVVLADATDAFNYDSLNEAFRLLIQLQEKGRAMLISLGQGRYYRDGEELTMDVGPFMKALEFATGVEAVVIGKPSRTFFMSALEDLQSSPENAVMVGDDVVSDVGGAQRCGLMGILVRTGKYRPSDECRADVTPDKVVDNLAQAVEFILSQSQ